MVQLWRQWCRLCGREDHCNSHIDVLINDGKDVPLFDTINKIFSTDIQHSLNNFTIMICTECYNLIRTIIHLNHRLPRVTSMFADLLSRTEDELDLNQIRSLHNLESDFEAFTLENAIKFEVSEIVDKELMHSRAIDSNPKIEQIEWDGYENENLGSQRYAICNESTSPGKTKETQNINNDFQLEMKVELLELAEENVHQEFIHCETMHSKPVNNQIEEDTRNNYYEDENVGSQNESILPEKTKNTQKKQARYTSKKNPCDEKTKPHYCSNCNQGFVTPYNYRRHMQREHGIQHGLKTQTFICRKCGMQFKSKSVYKDHKFSHIKCKYCEKTFRNSNALRVHEETHKKTSYICVVCGLKLNSQRNLKKHMVRQHDRYASSKRKTNYKCDYCDKVYKRSKTLKFHLIRHTGL